MNKRNLGRKDLFDLKAALPGEAKTWTRVNAVTGFLFMACSVLFSYTAQVTCPWMTPLIIGWALPHQLSIEKCHTYLPTATLMMTFSSVSFLFLDDSSLHYTDRKQPSVSQAVVSSSPLLQEDWLIQDWDLPILLILNYNSWTSSHLCPIPHLCPATPLIND